MRNRKLKSHQLNWDVVHHSLPLEGACYVIDSAPVYTCALPSIQPSIHPSFIIFLFSNCYSVFIRLLCVYCFDFLFFCVAACRVSPIVSQIETVLISLLLLYGCISKCACQAAKPNTTAWLSTVNLRNDQCTHTSTQHQQRNDKVVENELNKCEMVRVHVLENKMKVR